MAGVGVDIDGRTILAGLELDLRPGELWGLIGPSGSGKSTLMKIVLGLRAPTRGKVTLGGAPVAGPVGYVPQRDELHALLTVHQALTFAAELRLPRAPDPSLRARVDQVIRQVGLEERRDVRIARLSGGQQKRVSVAMELLTEPPLLVLDEPTSGLDPGLEGKMMELFASLARTGRILLVATHAMESLRRCDGLAVLVGGCLAYAGPPDEAPAYFGAPGFAGIFDVLPQRKPPAWAAAWSSSPQRGTFAGRTGVQPPEAPRAAARPPTDVAAQLAALKARLGKP